MGESKWDIGDNVKTVLLAAIVVLQLMLRSNTHEIKEDTLGAKADAAKAAQAADVNAARIKALGTEVRDARNEGRRTMGLAPLPASKEDPE